MEKNVKKVLFVFIMLICFNITAQNIIKIEQNNVGINKSILSKINNIKSSTDFTFIKSNGEIKSSISNSKIVQLDYNQINSIVNLNSALKSSIEIAVINVSNNYSNINLNSLNELTALNFIYLIVEINIPDSSLINSINVGNPNWIITYQFSLPE